MHWQKYYSIDYGEWIKEEGTPREVIKPGWAIVFNDNCAEPGKVAHLVPYRTERLAIRGAERLYKRVYGAFEGAFLDSEK